MSRHMMEMGLNFMPVPLEWAGYGYLAGEAPDPLDPDAPDGRFKILNVPSQGRIVAFERTSMKAIAETLSAADGTWRIDYLDMRFPWFVVGFDDAGTVNAAVQDWIIPAAMV